VFSAKSKNAMLGNGVRFDVYPGVYALHGFRRFKRNINTASPLIDF
jgi:hypothetical protein